MNWQDLLSKLNKADPDDVLTSDDPQSQVASKGFKQILDSAPVQKALDFEGNLKAYDDVVTKAMPTLDKTTHKFTPGDEAAGVELAERALGTAIGTIKAAELTPSDKIRALAKEYMAANKLKSLENQPYAKVNHDEAKRIAEAYEAMPHNPDDPAVQSSYKALIDETLAQYQKIKESGLNVEKIKSGMENPYPKGSQNLFDDINKNNHLWYYPTESGFGTTESASHPLLSSTSETINGEPVPANDLFRIVHDYFGHAKEGPGFGPRGEENAWREHAQMYTPEALKALTTETRGQNSWVNYGPKGEANRANPGSTTYADQKAGLMPEWTTQFNKTIETLKAKPKKSPTVDQILAENENPLFHSTTKKNIESIKDIGLQPQVGKIVEQSYDDYLNILKENGGESPDVSFLAEQPSAFYSHWQGLKKGQHPSYDDIRLHDLNKKGGAGLFKRQDDIYQAQGDYQPYNAIKSTDGAIENSIEEIPNSVEGADYFTFNRQDPEHIFTGTDFLELVTKKDSNFINIIHKKHKKLL